MSLLMSQKALNNTANQYISPLMGFSELLVHFHTHTHTQTQVHTQVQSTIWLPPGGMINGKWKNINHSLEG